MNENLDHTMKSKPGGHILMHANYSDIFIKFTYNRYKVRRQVYSI